MKPSDCPRFDKCCAPTCPFDANWSRCRTLEGEPVCGWLLEAAKPDARAILEGVLPRTHLEAVLRVCAELESDAGFGHAVLRKALRRAATKGSKVQAGRRLAASKHARKGAA